MKSVSASPKGARYTAIPGFSRERLRMAHTLSSLLSPFTIRRGTSSLLSLLAGIVLCLTLIPQGACSQSTDAEQSSPPSPGRSIIVAPSSTKILLGSARLVVGTLNRKPGKYVGDFEVTVFPYSFKNEKGTLVLFASDEAVRQVQKGKPVNFTGKATNAADGSIKIVKGTASPTSPDRGRVTFSILTPDGELTFNTTYHFTR